jgi:hypothetical protein
MSTSKTRAFRPNVSDSTLEKREVLSTTSHTNPIAMFALGNGFTGSSTIAHFGQIGTGANTGVTSGAGNSIFFGAVIAKGGGDTASLRPNPGGFIAYNGTNPFTAVVSRHH